MCQHMLKGLAQTNIFNIRESYFANGLGMGLTSRPINWIYAWMLACLRNRLGLESHSLTQPGQWTSLECICKGVAHTNASVPQRLDPFVPLKQSHKTCKYHIKHIDIKPSPYSVAHTIVKFATFSIFFFFLANLGTRAEQSKHLFP